MENELATGATTVKLQAAQPTPAERDGMADKALSCAILFLEIPEYATRPIAEQLRCRQRLTGHVAVALEAIPTDARIVLDTAAGIAISFLERPLAALEVLGRLLTNIAQSGDAKAQLPLHGALNLGPVRIAGEATRHLNMLGDGISVAQRLLAFAGSGNILVAKSYVETALAADVGYAPLFVYQGSRTDAHVRDHEIFELDIEALRDTHTHTSKTSPPAGGRASSEARHHPHRLAYGFVALSAVALTGALTNFFAREPEEPHPPFSQRSLKVAAIPARPGASEPSLTRPTSDADLVAQRAKPDALASAATAGEQWHPSTGPAVPPSGTSEVHRASTPAPAVPATTKASKQHRTEPPRKDALAGAGGPSAVSASPRQPVVETPITLQAWRPVELTQLSAGPGAAGSAAVKPIAGPSALVTLAISPWGEIFVDGRSVGVSPPLREFELAVGKHRIAVRNGDFKPFEQDLEVNSNQTVRLKHKFSQRS